MIRFAPLRPALLSATLLLSACSGTANPFGVMGDVFGSPLAGSGKFLSDTNSFTLNPNRPVADVPNINRVLGQGYEQEPLLPEGGNVWPGPLPPDKTLSDLQKEAPLGMDAEPAAVAAPTRPAPPPSAAPRKGRVLQTPVGPGVTSVDATGHETILLPNGQTGTVTPAGSGTATVKLPDGKTYTVADPR